MDDTPSSGWLDYILLFFGMGTVAVLIKLASDFGGARYAGVVSMIPMKILIAWAIVGSSGGSAAIVQSTNGMLLGLLALVCCILTMRCLVPYVPVYASIAFSVAVWASVVALVLRTNHGPIGDG